MTLDTFALIENELEARRVPALLVPFNGGARRLPGSHKRCYISIHDDSGMKLEFTDVDPTLSCQVIDANGAVIENIDSDIPSDTADVKLVADWIATTYTLAQPVWRAQRHADALRKCTGAREVTLTDNGALLAVSAAHAPPQSQDDPTPLTLPEGEEEHGTTYVTITPNFSHLVQQFTRDAMIHAGILERSTDARVVSSFRGFVVSLNVAIQALESAESVEFVRAELDKLRERIVARDEHMREEPESR